jgi:hypothetical protein
MALRLACDVTRTNWFDHQPDEMAPTFERLTAVHLLTTQDGPVATA